MYPPAHAVSVAPENVNAEQLAAVAVGPTTVTAASDGVAAARAAAATMDFKGNFMAHPFRNWGARLPPDGRRLVNNAIIAI